MATGSHFAMLAVLAMTGVAAVATSAKADVIDGDWCAKDGRHLAIHGPAVVTPGGNQTEGDYSRHSFRYVVPPGEESAGQPVTMLLLNESTVEVQMGDGGAAEIWLRCTPSLTS